MWEDGGSLVRVAAEWGDRDGAVEDDGFTATAATGGSVLRKDARSPGQWTIVTTEHSVAVASANGNSVNGRKHVSDHVSDTAAATSSRDLANLERRNNLVERNLADIYQSPFQQLTYACAADSDSSSLPQQQQQGRQSSHTKAISARLKTHRSDDSQQHHQQQGSLRLTSQDGGVDGQGHRGAFDDNGDGNDDDRSAAGAGSEEEAEGRELGVVTAGGGGGATDAHSILKASISRASRRAVRGYRACRDVDTYVGARAKPTLILARAPSTREPLVLARGRARPSSSTSRSLPILSRPENTS